MENWNHMGFGGASEEEAWEDGNLGELGAWMVEVDGAGDMCEGQKERPRVVGGSRVGVWGLRKPIAVCGWGVRT